MLKKHFTLLFVNAVDVDQPFQPLSFVHFFFIWFHCPWTVFVHGAPAERWGESDCERNHHNNKTINNNKTIILILGSLRDRVNQLIDCVFFRDSLLLPILTLFLGHPFSPFFLCVCRSFRPSSLLVLVVGRVRRCGNVRLWVNKKQTKQNTTRAEEKRGQH